MRAQFTPRRRQIMGALAAIMVGLTGGLLAPAVAQATDPAPQCYRGPNENAYYKITNAATGKSLDVSYHSLANGAAVGTYTYTGAANQQWRPVCVAPFAYKFIARHSGLVLDIPGYSTADGVKVQQYGYNGGTNQQWTIGRAGTSGDLITFQLQNVHSTKALEPATDGQSVQQFPGNPDNTRQQWTLEQVGTV